MSHGNGDDGATIHPFQPKPTKAKAPRDTITEQSVARDFRDSHGQMLRFDHDRGRWLVWQGHYWRPDRRKHAFFWVLDHCHAMGIKKAERAGFANAVETITRALPPISTCSEDWNSNPEYVATPNGVIELGNGILRPGRPEDMIDRALGVTPDNTNPPNRWFSFLDRMFDGHGDIIDFLQRWGGYCLSGHISEHKFVFLHGSGANGKGTLLNTMAFIWDRLCATAGIDVFLESQSDRHPTEIARLNGAHLALVHETKEGRRWDEAKIKTMTGGDRLTARFMRQDEFEFLPRFKPMFAGNHKPSLRTVDEAIRRRLLFLPCTVIIPPDERDPELSEKLRAEAPAILAWFIEGYQHWRRSGLRPPEAVTTATEDYLSQQDELQQWIEECTEPSGDSTLSQTLFANWSQWAEARKTYTGSSRNFLDKMTDKGYVRKKTMAGIELLCIKLKNQDY